MKTLAVVTETPAALATRLVEQAKPFLESHLAPGTRRVHERHWRGFETWYTEKGLELREALSEPLLVGYLGELATQPRERTGRPYKTKVVELVYASIRATRREAGAPLGAMPNVERFLEGLRRRRVLEGERATQKAPISIAMLKAMVSTLPADTYVGARDRAILVLGFAGAFRRSELALLDVDDVTFVDEGIVVRVKKSKTNQKGSREEKAIHTARDPAVCAARLVRTWILLLAEAKGPLFRTIRRGGHVTPERLTDRSIAELVKRTTKAAGLDPALFSGHSMRAGFMTAGAAKGLQLHDLMRQSGHKSERIARGYIRHANMFTNNPTKDLL